MKIYALDFRLELRTELPSAHFTWQRQELTVISDQLRSRGVDFADQMFYAKGSMDSLSLVQGLLEDEQVAAQRATLVLFFKSPDLIPRFFEALQTQYRPESAAGGLVLNESNELLLIHRLGRWDLPKGKVEKGESNPDAAWREVAEETALEGHVMGNHIGDTYHVFKRKKKWTFKVTYWYAMSVENAKNLQPQTDEGITGVEWWSQEKIQKELPTTYPLIEDLLLDAF